MNVKHDIVISKLTLIRYNNIMMVFEGLQLLKAVRCGHQTCTNVFSEVHIYNKGLKCKTLGGVVI